MHRFLTSYFHHPPSLLCVCPLLSTSHCDSSSSYTHTLSPFLPVEPLLQAWPLLRGLHPASQGQKFLENLQNLQTLPLLLPLLSQVFSLLWYLLPHNVLPALRGLHLSLRASSRPTLSPV